MTREPAKAEEHEEYDDDDYEDEDDVDVDDGTKKKQRGDQGFLLGATPMVSLCKTKSWKDRRIVATGAVGGTVLLVAVGVRCNGRSFG